MFNIQVNNFWTAEFLHWLVLFETIWLWRCFQASLVRIGQIYVLQALTHYVVLDIRANIIDFSVWTSGVNLAATIPAETLNTFIPTLCNL